MFIRASSTGLGSLGWFILVFLSRDRVLIVSFHTSLAAMFTMMIMHGTGCLVN